MYIHIDHHDDGHEDYLSLKAYCLRSLKLVWTQPAANCRLYIATTQ